MRKAAPQWQLIACFVSKSQLNCAQATLFANVSTTGRQDPTLTSILLADMAIGAVSAI